MNIDIVCVGNLKEKYLKDGMDEYLKRLKSYANINIIEIPESTKGAVEEIKKEEGEKILSKVKKDTFLIPLVIGGKELSSVELAELVEETTTYRSSHLTFVIGGSDGLCYDIVSKGDFDLSFSKFTFPHQLMRLILIEQIYRTMKILKNEQYHK